MKTINCDRCGEEIENEESSGKLILASESDTCRFIDNRGDYCDECKEIIHGKIQEILYEKLRDAEHQCYVGCPHFTGPLKFQ